MAEKRKPGFNIPLNFYDGPEVESIPKRIRAAAVGVWALAGDYAATQLTDGYIGAGALKQFGCTGAIREALKVTINKKGELSPLWVEARNGGVQLTNWAKHQRTNAEVTTYRASEADRKRAVREAQREAELAEDTTNLRDNIGEVTPNLRSNSDEDGTHVGDENQSGVDPDGSPTSTNAKVSGRTSAGQAEIVRSDARDPKTETETETKKRLFGYVPDEATDPNAHGISATPAAQLVREIIPSGHPSATLTSLRLQSSELLNNGHDRADVADALRLWCSKPGVGIGRTIVASLVSEVIKGRTGANGKPAHKVRAFLDLAAEVRADEQAQLESANRKAIE